MLMMDLFELFLSTFAQNSKTVITKTAKTVISMNAGWSKQQSAGASRLHPALRRIEKRT